MRKRDTILYYIIAFTLILGVRDGRIALWKQAQPEKAYLFPYRVEMLPPQDQQRLRQGIPIDSASKLHTLLEDYLS